MIGVVLASRFLIAGYIFDEVNIALLLVELGESHQGRDLHRYAPQTYAM